MSAAAVLNASELIQIVSGKRGLEPDAVDYRDALIELGMLHYKQREADDLEDLSPEEQRQNSREHDADDRSDQAVPQLVEVVPE